MGKPAWSATLLREEKKGRKVDSRAKARINTQVSQLLSTRERQIPKGTLPASHWATLITLSLGLLCVCVNGGKPHTSPILLDHGPLPTLHGRLSLVGLSQDESLMSCPCSCPHQAELMRLLIRASGLVGPVPGPPLAAETNQLPYWTLPEDIYT